MPFAERALTAVWLGAALLLFAASLWVQDVSLRLFLDNASWTLAFGLSAFWAWQGRAQVPPEPGRPGAAGVRCSVGVPFALARVTTLPSLWPWAQGSAG